MSIVNRSHRFIFVHIPKAAGTSVTNVLSRYTGIGDVEIGGTAFGESLAVPYATRFGLYKHSTARELRALVGPAVWNESFTFAFVRNPFARAYSNYRFLKDRFRGWKGSECMDRFDTFDAFVASDFFQTDGPDRLLRPQNFWVRTSEADEKPCVDFVGHVEFIDTDLPNVTNRIEGAAVGDSAPLGTVPRTNSSAQPNEWRTMYCSAETARIVRERYADDIRLFGYLDTPTPGG